MNLKLKLLKAIEKYSKEFSITTDDPIKEKGPLDFQPNLCGCDKKDLKIYSLSIRGTLANAKKLVKIETPLGVQIDLLPQSV